MSKSLPWLAPVLVASLAACEPQPLEIVSTPNFSAAETAGAVFAEVRAATAQYHRVEVAIAAGYVRHTPCIYNTPGGRGYIYSNFALIDGVVDASHPEVLIYEPTKNGEVQLVAAAFAVRPAEWSGSAPPTLGGQVFTAPSGPAAPNYLLTAWVWRHNPDGLHAFYNPQVSCEFADASVVR